MRLVRTSDLLCAVALLLAPIRPLAAQSRWRTEDRVVLGSMLRIQAVASSFDRLFVVGGGRVMYQDLGRPGWQGPFDAPVDAEFLDVRGSIVDPLDRSLWVVTGSGWLRYDPTLDRWDRGFAGGQVVAAGLDRGRPVDGLYLRLPTGWMVATRGGGIVTPAAEAPRPGQFISIGTLDEAARANPQLGGMLSGTLMAPGLRTVRLNAAAPAADQSGWWLGTDGAGLYWLPFGSVIPERRSWGLPGDEVGGVFAVPGGAWAVTDESLEGDAALVFVPEALDHFDWYFGDRVFGQPFRAVRVVHVVDSLVWAGTDQGAVAFDRHGVRVRRLDERDGLADRRILSIAARRGRLVLGTAAGVAEVSDSGVQRLAPNFVSPALALALSGDTTWVGTSIGLFATLPGMGDLRSAPGWDGVDLARHPVTALLWRGDTLVALTDRAVVWRDPGTGHWTVGPDLDQRVGRTHALADGRDGVWVAGSLGLGFARLGGPVMRLLASGDDLPGEAWDVSIDGDRIWVATPHGLVRFRRQAVEP
ncbi:MAG TPA: hypothetical protein VFI13_03620 [Gemmatimonadales bacterium]|nr:hypothetical protein [Gemmatimonadales bacterium]